LDNLTDAKLVSVGVDFGYTNDPSAIIAIFERDGKMIIDEVAYNTGMMNADIAAQIPAGVVAWCDSAEPKSIAELCSRGVAAKPVVKGKDSIQNGIGIIQQRGTFYVTQRSTNLIKELRGYCWEKDASGKMTNVPRGVDHAIDAMRYGVMMHYGHRPRIKSAVI
jgi:phage terminase large subunit